METSTLFYAYGIFYIFYWIYYMFFVDHTLAFTFTGEDWASEKGEQYIKDNIILVSISIINLVWIIIGLIYTAHTISFIYLLFANLIHIFLQTKYKDNPYRALYIHGISRLLVVAIIYYNEFFVNQ